MVDNFSLSSFKNQDMAPGRLKRRLKRRGFQVEKMVEGSVPNSYFIAPKMSFRRIIEALHQQVVGLNVFRV